MSRLGAVVLGAMAVLALSATPALANTYAAVEQHPADQSRTDTDINVMDATTGASVLSVSGVNTAQNEAHPSISSDGKQLVFERRNPTTGGVRILLANLSTGTTTDLFDSFDVAQQQPNDPAITPDGTLVATGAPLAHVENAGADFQGMLTFTPPSGSPHTQRVVLDNQEFGGTVDQVTASAKSLFAFQATTGGNGEIYLDNAGQVSGGVAGGSVGAPVALSHPALAATNPQYVLFDARPENPNGSFGPGDIEFRPVDGFQGDAIPLTGLNTSADESEPALTPDGRFVAFIRHTDGFDRLFLWDTETQEFLNGAGIALGKIDSRDRDGDVSLYVKSTFSGPVHVTATSVAAHINHGSGLGILVQRIVGRHKVLGREEFKLRKVGRVPLGKFRKGRHHIRWKLRVGGKRLKPGRYLLTLRALNRRKVVTDLAKPTVVRVRARHRPKKY